MQRYFNELKVVELANVLAGPAAGMFFAELGAEVIKIENKRTGGDVTRSWKLPSEDLNSDVSAYYSSVNWNKKIQFLDLTDNHDKQKAYELIKTADVVIANYKKGDDGKLGMDFETLKKINPTLIYGHISGFGDSSRTAFDLVLQAETGFMFMNGNPGSGPLKMPVALIDILAAHQLKEGILVAMIQKLKTGKGAKVSVSLYDAAIASLANQASNWLMAKHDPQPDGSLHPNIAPYGELFKTSDNAMIVLAIGNDKQFENLCKILDRTELLSDERFRNNTSRVKNRAELFTALRSAFEKADSKVLMERFVMADVPAGKICSVKDVFSAKAASDLVLHQPESQGAESLRVRTAIFTINS
jgi:crotonobetainyl-CoA:carnitine CoA-transferase CaiB-like acyl-CoA transferase